MYETTLDMMTCCVCMERNESIDKSIGALIQVLSLCIPEVAWKAEWRICKLCEAQVTIITHFRDRCLLSYQKLTQSKRAVDSQIPDHVENYINNETILNPVAKCNENVELGSLHVSIKEELIDTDLNETDHDTYMDSEFVDIKSEDQSNKNGEEMQSVKMLCAEDFCKINMDNLDDSDTFTPEDFLEQAQSATLDLLPAKSKAKYYREYNNFDRWKKEKNFIGLSEEMLMEYFSSIANMHKMSSVMAKYYMLKSTLKIYQNVDISRFIKLMAYLKGKSKMYTKIKSKTLEQEYVQKFLSDADDNKYLMIKVTLIIGLFGACTCEELTKLCVDDIEDKGTYLLITLPNPKTNIVRKFTIITDGYSVNIIDLYKKYASLRPDKVSHRRFFLNYKDGKCTVQPVGINTLSKVPKEIAIFLNLPNPEIYTGHCFRRTSANFLGK